MSRCPMGTTASFTPHAIPAHLRMAEASDPGVTDNEWFSTLTAQPGRVELPVAHRTLTVWDW